MTTSRLESFVDFEIAAARHEMRERIDARCNAALADHSLAESARRSIAQIARWIAHDFHLHPEKKR
jgi:hypothetical protein